MTANLRRVNRSSRCPICGSDSWCSVRDDGLAVCMRVPSDRKTKDGTGFVHSVDSAIVPAARPSEPVAKLSIAECTLLARQCNADMTDRRRDEFAQKLGVSVAALRSLRVGWHIDNGVFTFPMRDSEGRIIGIRTRTPEGTKRAIKGSTSGLFIPQDIKPIDPSVLLITEGPTDCGAAVDLGFMAIGRPDATNGADFIVQYVKHHRPERLVIIADDDSATHDVGWRGADVLARKLIANAVESVRVLTAPDSFKDLRGWLNSGGASFEDLAAHIEADAPSRIEVAA